MKKLLFLCLVLFLIPLISAQWDDCRFGITDCEIPCGLYIDTNADGECDHGQLEPVKEVKEIVTPVKVKYDPPYNFFPVSIILLVAYAISFIAANKKKIKLINHKKFWNVLLLLNFLATGITGILLVLRVNYGWAIRLPFNVLYWHVETGIVMAIISIFHIFWHLKYFTRMFNR